MIIQEAVSAPVITSIGAVPSKFKIKASAKAFKILSGFYSEPILAIPRELGANAWDAHVKAKNTNMMFEVHAPNNLEPWFSIRDFGTGLSPEDIDQIYTTYFESTKTQDNDSDGCMGLGSKTPFNYTENFTVTSYFNGTKYVYNCFIDESGSPNILPVANEPTKEHNGLQIKFGVKIADISMFVDKIKRAYEPFRFRPTIVGADIKFAPREYQFEGTGWGLRKNESRYRSGSSCRAFMGNYSYPINYESLRNYISEHVKQSGMGNNIYKMLSNGDFDFFYNIGDLEVAPNKEQLQYDGDHKTAKAICDRCIVAYEELQKKVNDSIKTPKTRWEAMSLYVKYNSYNGAWNNVRNIIGNIKIRFNGEDVESGQIGADTVNLRSGISKKTNDPYAEHKTEHKMTVAVLHYRTNTDKFMLRDRGYYNVTESGDFPLFLYTNTETLKKARIRHFLKTKFPNGNIPDTMLIIDLSPGYEYFKKHCEFLGIPDTQLVHVEDLPKPPRVPREARTVTTNEIHFVKVENIDVNTSNGRRYFNSAYWQQEAHTFTGAETYFYVDFYYSDQVWNGRTISDQMDAILRFIKIHKLIPEKLDKIWGINKKNSNLLKVGKWVNVVDLAKKGMEKHREEYEQNLYMLGLTEPLNRLSNLRRIINDSTLLTNLTNAETKKKLRGLISLQTQINSIYVDTECLSNFFGVKAKAHTPSDVDPKEFEKEIKEKYFNVFGMIDHYNIKGTDLARLINFIDEKS